MKPIYTVKQVRFPQLDAGLAIREGADLMGFNLSFHNQILNQLAKMRKTVVEKLRVQLGGPWLGGLA